MSYPDGLRRVRPARVIITKSRAITEPIIFALPPREELVRTYLIARGTGQ